MERNSKLLLSILGAIIFGLATEPMWGDALVQGRGEKNDGSVGALVRLALRCRQISVSRSSSRRKQPNSEEGKNGEGEGPDEQRPEWDTLCLVLGTLTNLVESNDEVKELLRETRKSSMLLHYLSLSRAKLIVLICQKWSIQNASRIENASGTATVLHLNQF